MHDTTARWKTAILFALALGIATCGGNGGGGSAGNPPQANPIDPIVQAHADDMLEAGRETFRFDTFGDEAFWGDTLRLHQAIAGAANGGVGAGLSPRAALELGLKVDAEALPQELQDAIGAGDGRPRRSGDDAGPSRARRGGRRDRLLRRQRRLTSIGIQCALCHSTVDDSFAPGIGQRLDGWPNRDLNVGAIIAFAPDVSVLSSRSAWTTTRCAPCCAPGAPASSTPSCSSTARRFDPTASPPRR